MISRCIFFICWFGGLLTRASSFSIERKNLPGVWKLKFKEDCEVSFVKKKTGESILIRIQEDGYFQQCDDDDDGDYGPKKLHGCWEFEDSELQLAFDRKCHSSPADVLLSGKVSGEEDATRIPNGIVSEGKFMYPTTHAAFFDQVMATSEQTGKFSLKQIMGFNQLMSLTTIGGTKDEEEENQTPKYTVSDFFDRKFFMTIVPIECKIKPPKEWDKQKRSWYNPLDDQAADIRTMPIQFFANSTFEAVGVNKILRGRFEITKDNKLWFRVSRFGMGRSVPGSVYSEGIGLSHEDERTYVGTIEEQSDDRERRTLRVEGKVTFGNDMGSDARPEPVGTFLMHEVDDASLEMNEDEDAEANEDIFDSVFE
ncbi:expressed unknown protein [Seminavis robusta]|uniref:Uncharacterized protein n=1 Tax=Seminavis robusta TaxID=568900 RepID=A0A9N8EG11_9STRA|nr:expressed unknown protein [Seminavis robusta]|eukprot:Sro944_g222990.1 n/a (368) ;mRNA; r:32047-33150